jgi:hypothetical protein
MEPKKNSHETLSSNDFSAEANQYHAEDIYSYKMKHPDFSEALKDRPMLMRFFKSSDDNL